MDSQRYRNSNKSLIPRVNMLSHPRTTNILLSPINCSNATTDIRAHYRDPAGQRNGLGRPSVVTTKQPSMSDTWNISINNMIGRSSTPHKPPLNLEQASTSKALMSTQNHAKRNNGALENNVLTINSKPYTSKGYKPEPPNFSNDLIRSDATERDGAGPTMYNKIKSEAERNNAKPMKYAICQICREGGQIDLLTNISKNGELTKLVHNPCLLKHLQTKKTCQCEICRYISQEYPSFDNQLKSLVVSKA